MKDFAVEIGAFCYDFVCINTLDIKLWKFYIPPPDVNIEKINR